jgi:hypothetical protein
MVVLSLRTDRDQVPADVRAAVDALKRKGSKVL